MCVSLQMCEYFARSGGVMEIFPHIRNSEELQCSDEFVSVVGPESGKEEITECCDICG